MTNQEKAIKRLADCDISAYEDDGYVFIVVGGLELEISQTEVNFQAELYDRDNKENQ